MNSLSFFRVEAEKKKWSGSAADPGRGKEEAA